MSNLALFEKESNNRRVNIKKASKWATAFLNRDVSPSNISYLVQYGRIGKHGSGSAVLIDLGELEEYYKLYGLDQLRKRPDDGFNWKLSFTEYRESERTKHVHRLHPYKGKFIPQLVEYFIDSHTDDLKREIFFNENDIILDPFCGSGTTLVQSNELGIHAVGIDVSAFNTLISNIKLASYDVYSLIKVIDDLSKSLRIFQQDKSNIEFENDLLEKLARFNLKYFPSPEYKRRARNGEIDERKYSKEKAEEFLQQYRKLVKQYSLQVAQNGDTSFLGTWFLQPVRDEINFMFALINEIDDPNLKKIIAVIFSRTVRSCRATTHADLATLKQPVTTTYYCRKHGKVCKPIFSISGWWKRYCQDTLNRISKFNDIRTDTDQICITGDSRTIDVFDEIGENNKGFAERLSKQKFKGIFSSPPYVGLIDYHEQHAYAYELFGYERRDNLEIGPLVNGQGKEARESYVKGVSDVLKNCKKYFTDDYNVLLVANDKHNLYPRIADLSNMKIVNQFKRPVLNRVEKNRAIYSETIFHMKEK